MKTLSARLQDLSFALLAPIERAILDVIGNSEVTRNKIHWHLPQMDTDDIDSALKQLVSDGALEQTADGYRKRG